jgi:hypothetical protein
MALQIRRGTNAERQQIIPLQGELLFTTDTKKLWVGDGVTQGGVAVDTLTGSGGGASSISELTDVNITSPTNGQVLKFNGSAWINAADLQGEEGAAALEELENVDINSIEDGQILRWDSTILKWVNSTETIPAINQLQGVIIDAPVDGQVLKFNGLSWVNDVDATAENTVSILSDLTDVTINGVLTVGQVLKWTGESWTNSTDETGSLGGGAVNIGDLNDVLIVTGELTDGQVLKYIDGVWINQNEGFIDEQVIQDAFIGLLPEYTGFLTAGSISATESIFATELISTPKIVTAGIFRDATDASPVLDLFPPVAIFKGSVYDNNNNPVLNIVDLTIVEGEEETILTTRTLNVDNININSQGSLGGISIVTTGTEDDDVNVFTIESYHNESSYETAQIFLRARGTPDSPLPIVAGDGIVDNIYLGFADPEEVDGPLTSSYVARVSVNADLNGTVIPNIIPGRYTISTSNSSGALVEGLSIDSNQVIGVANNVLIAGTNPGEVDDTTPATYLKIKIGSTEYAIPAYTIRP